MKSPRRLTRRCKPTKGASALGSFERQRYFRFGPSWRPQPFAVERPSVTPPARVALLYLQIVGGIVVLAVSAAYPITRYLSLPRSGYYNRPDEKTKLAERAPFNTYAIRVVIVGVAIGLGLIVDALRKLAV